MIEPLNSSEPDPVEKPLGERQSLLSLIIVCLTVLAMVWMFTR